MTKAFNNLNEKIVDYSIETKVEGLRASTKFDQDFLKNYPYYKIWLGRVLVYAAKSCLPK